MAKKQKRFPKVANLQEKIVALFVQFKGKMPAKWQPHITKKNFLIAFIVLFFLVQYMQVSKVTGGISSLANRGSSLVDEVGQLNEVTAMLAEDLTEVRGFLLLPTRQYASSVDFDESSSDSGNEDDLHRHGRIREAPASARAAGRVVLTGHQAWSLEASSVHGGRVTSRAGGRTYSIGGCHRASQHCPEG